MKHTLPDSVIHSCSFRASLVVQTVKNPPAVQETRVQSLDWKVPWRSEWQPKPVFSPVDSHGRRSLGDYGPQARKESETAERPTLGNQGF